MEATKIISKFTITGKGWTAFIIPILQDMTPICYVKTEVKIYVL